VITTFSVTNFRAFENSGQLPLGPLTCLVGRNSSGKSSLLHALLVLRQSIEQRAVGSRTPQLNLNGSLIDAGSYRDIVHHHKEDRQVEFRFEINLEPMYSSGGPVGSRRPLVAAPFGPPLISLDVPRPAIMRYVPNPRVIGARRKPDVEHRKKVHVSMSFLPEPPFGPTLSRLTIEVDSLGAVTFTRTVKRRRVQHWRAYPTNLPPKTFAIYFSAWSFLPQLGMREARLDRLPPAERSAANDFAWYAGRGLRDIDQFLSNLRLVGPFRTPPARRYSFSGLAAVDTGPSGERAVDLLITEKLIRSAGQPLRLAVSYWLKRLGLAKKIAIRDLAKRSNIFELAISGAGTARTANFADVGFGISQVLPVLVQGFLVPRGGTYIAQQPELHLHPDAQAGLADFFLYLASRGVRVLIETHSEYLLVRLRRRLAEGVRDVKIGLPNEERISPILIDKAAITVAYVGETEAAARVSLLKLDDSFQFENLPRGFMSQSVDDRLALMKALKTR
jgi:predicted ATPase